MWLAGVKMQQGGCEGNTPCNGGVGLNNWLHVRKTGIFNRSREDPMFVDCGDAQLLTYVFGSGSKTLLTHGGWVGSGELWLPVLERLGPGWRGVAYDHRGTGATVNRAPHITFDRLVDDLFTVMDRLNIGQCVLAGESAGALVALEAALRRPDRFSGLVLVGARTDGRRSPQTDRLLAGCKADFAATMSAFVDACVPEPDREAERAWGRKIVMRSNPKDAVELMECLEGVEVQSRLSGLALPVLILHGRKDAIAPLEQALALVDRLPQAELVIADDAGHVPTVTRPQWVAAEIDARFKGMKDDGHGACYQGS